MRCLPIVVVAFAFIPALLLAPPAGAQGGVQKTTRKQTFTPPDAGWWRGRLLIDETRSVGFFFELPRIGHEGDFIGRIVNGRERIDVALIWDHGKLRFEFPHYDAVIECHRAPIGAEIGLFGEYRLTTSGGRTRVMTFEAAPVGAGRPSPSGRNAEPLPARAPQVDFSGEWKIDFEKSGPAKGVFRQPGGSDVVTGTILTTTGDYRYLSGGVAGRQFAISVFDGAHAFLVTARADESGDSLTGTFRSGAHYEEAFTAVRVPQGETYELPDPFEQVGLTNDQGRLRLGLLDDPKYRGKPVVVTFFGTWCPNCHDEAPVLVDLHERYAPRGLEMLGLAYEHTSGGERSRRQVERFKRRYGIPWEIVVAGESSKLEAAAMVPDLTAIKSWPTTVFIGRDGRVKAIHSGFAGPATGEEHRELVNTFDRIVREMVEEPAP